MDVHNLAIMFGPTLVRPQDSSILVMARDNGDQCRVVESIIAHVCHVFISNVIPLLFLSFLPRDASAERGYEIAFVCLSVCP